MRLLTALSAALLLLPSAAQAGGECVFTLTSAEGLPGDTVTVELLLDTACGSVEGWQASIAVEDGLIVEAVRRGDDVGALPDGWFYAAPTTGGVRTGALIDLQDPLTLAASSSAELLQIDLTIAPIASPGELDLDIASVGARPMRSVVTIARASVVPSTVAGTVTVLTAPGVTFTPTSARATTEAGGTDTYDVALRTVPSDDVVLTLSSTDTDEGTVSPPTITFEPGDWDTAQTVTVAGVDDDVDDGDTAWFVTHTATSLDGAYQGVSIPSIEVLNSDDDTAGVTVTPTSGLSVAEDGGSTTFDVVLDSQPTGAVAIAVATSDDTEGTVFPATLNYSIFTWDTPQSVTVLAEDDPDDDGDVIWNAETTSTSLTDDQYDGIEVADPEVTTLDDDTVGVTIEPAVPQSVGENGSSAAFTIVLDSRPDGSVTVGALPSDVSEGGTSPTAFSFTESTWDTAQALLVTGVDDNIDDGDQPWTVRTTVSSQTDPMYDGFDPPDPAMTTIDNDTVGFVVSPSSVETSEAGQEAPISIRLATRPLIDVALAVAISDDTEVTLDVASVSWTPQTWDEVRTVTVSPVDDGLDDGDIAYTVTLGPVTSSDNQYSVLDPPDLAGINYDDDAVEIAVDAAIGLTSTEEGGTASFTVAVGSQPSATVTIAVSSSDPSEGTVSPQSLVFTPETWQVAQTVTAIGVDDDEADGAVNYTVALAPAVSDDPQYNGIDPRDVTVSNVDDDTTTGDDTGDTGTSEPRCGCTAAPGAAGWPIVLLLLAGGRRRWTSRER